TTTRPYQPTIILSGSGFTSVTQISWACTTRGSPCANSPYVWTPANWSTKFSVTSDSVASVAPVLVAPTDPPGTTQWSVTFTAGSQTVTKSFSVTYSPPVTLQVNGFLSSYTTTTRPYQPTIILSGSGFTSVTQISWACTTRGSPCANSPYVWTPANWSTKFSVTSDSVASVAPVLVAPTDPPGTTQWSVTFTAGSQTVTKSFSVTYSPPVTAPTITGVSPSPVTGSSSQQTITIIGTNFVNKPTLTLTWTGQPNYTVPTAQVTFISSTQLQMAINTTTQA